MLPARMARAKTLTARMRWRSVHRSRQRGPCSSSFLGKSVPHAVKRLARLELALDLPELASQPLDMAVDGAIVDIDIFLIGDVHQLVARLHHPWALGERLQDHELGNGERDVAAGPADAVPRRIHDQAAS